MYSYEDFLKTKNQPFSKLVEFVNSCIFDYKASAKFKEAVIAEKYYDGENPTINKIQKLVQNALGQTQNSFSPNHKIASQFFPFVIDQEISYLLRNGVGFQNDSSTKKILGENFDEVMCDLITYSRIHGECFAFWNFDHLELFKLTEFVPLFSEKDASFKAGIRFWQFSIDKPLYITIFEDDGITELSTVDGKMSILSDKHDYKQTTFKNAFETTTKNAGNYKHLPIFEVKNGLKALSAIHGKRSTLDALDITISQMTNNVDEGTLVYWIFKNYGGLIDSDDQNDFFQKFLATHVINIQGDDGDAQMHTVEAKVDSSKTAIEQLTTRLHIDFQTFNYSEISTGNQTATAIEAAFSLLELKCAKIEDDITKFIRSLLAFLDIDDSPKYSYNKLLNKSDETTMFISAAPFTSDEYVTEKLLTMYGDIDSIDISKKQLVQENLDNLKQVGNE